MVMARAPNRLMRADGWIVLNATDAHISHYAPRHQLRSGSAVERSGPAGRPLRCRAAPLLALRFMLALRAAAIRPAAPVQACWPGAQP